MRGCFSLVLLQSDTEGGEKKHSGVHTAKWRTDPVCCRILRLLFALAGVQHACPPLLDSVRVTHVRLPPARRRPAAAAGSGSSSSSCRAPRAEPGASYLGQLPEFPSPPPKSRSFMSRTGDQNVLFYGRPPPQLLDSRTVTASPATCSRRPASPFWLLFLFSRRRRSWTVAHEKGCAAGTHAHLVPVRCG